jgi:PilZ domain
MQERRRIPRTLRYKYAKISFNGSFRGCLVRNVSSHGARLALVGTAFIIPDKISLTFDNARTVACRVAWRSATEIGVEFSEASFRPAI